MHKIENVFETTDAKGYKSPNYNFLFNKKNGHFARFGKDMHEDPPMGLPELVDMEISEICSGIKGKVCEFCYKSNTTNGKNMSFETFKKVFDKLPNTVTQIAFGIGDIDSNPDLWKIMEYTRANGVIPNITINGDRLTPKIINKLAKTCGAVAVSMYDEELTLNAVDALSKAGLKQINIHVVLSKETEDRIWRLFDLDKNDKRLKNLNAIVMLSIKQKGRGKSFNKISPENYDKLVNYALKNEISIGFDSCGCSKFLNSQLDNPNFEAYKMVSEPCESGLFSSYINVDGMFFPCSFMEGENLNVADNSQNWKIGIDCVNCETFLDDVWNNPKTLKWKEILKANKDSIGCRLCPRYDV